MTSTSRACGTARQLHVHSTAHGWECHRAASTQPRCSTCPHARPARSAQHPPTHNPLPLCPQALRHGAAGGAGAGAAAPQARVPRGLCERVRLPVRRWGGARAAVHSDCGGLLCALWSHQPPPARSQLTRAAATPAACAQDQPAAHLCRARDRRVLRPLHGHKDDGAVQPVWGCVHAHAMRGQQQRQCPQPGNSITHPRRNERPCVRAC